MPAPKPGPSAGGYVGGMQTGGGGFTGGGGAGPKQAPGGQIGIQRTGPGAPSSGLFGDVISIVPNQGNNNTPSEVNSQIKTNKPKPGKPGNKPPNKGNNNTPSETKPLPQTGPTPSPGPTSGNAGGNTPVNPKKTGGFQTGGGF